ncbi:hypothetical protein [Microseira wollei]|uniref:hypothetical protein n=1 Tax=Microseira wollei TaxID=467598 RepID=UPI001CFC7CDE|nr:hypothetical protein [Microseira wollei]
MPTPQETSLSFGVGGQARCLPHKKHHSLLGEVGRQDAYPTRNITLLWVRWAGKMPTPQETSLSFG